VNGDDVVNAELVVADDDLAALARWRRPAPGQDRKLSAGAQRLVNAGIPDTTRNTYKRAWDHYSDWAAEYFGERYEEELLPSLQSTMIEYLHSWERLPVHNRCAGGRQANGDPCTGHRPAPSTMWIWYSSARMAHSLTDPPTAWFGGKQLALAMKAYSEKMATELGWEPNSAPRAWPENVMAMVDALDLDDEAHIRDRAILLVGWYTGARASDLATYRIGDVAFTPQGVYLTLRQSKTNKAVGKKVERRAIRPASNPAYDAVGALDAYINGVLRGRHNITQGALLRPYTRPGPKNGKRTLLRGHRDELGYRMAGVSISDIVKECAIRAGVPNAEYFTEHSLRRGRASHLRTLKVDSLAIGRALGWAGLPPTTYMEEAEAFDDDAPAAIGQLG
jgi:integrase